MHDANGMQLQKGDKVLIPATITEVYPSEEYCNVTVKSTLGRRPDGNQEVMTLNTGVLIKDGPGMSFGAALYELKRGFKVAREGWNGKGMWLVLMPSLSLPPFSSQEPGAKVNDRTAKHIGVDTPLECQPYIVMWTAQQKWQPGWLASQADMLAEDWMIVEDSQ